MRGTHPLRVVDHRTGRVAAFSSEERESRRVDDAVLLGPNDPFPRALPSLVDVLSGGGADCNGERPTILGNGSGNVLMGTPGRDVIAGGDGDDRIFGNAGHDWVDGGSGNDRITGGWGNGVLRGGVGNDRLVSY